MRNAWPDSSPLYRGWRKVVHDSAQGAAAVATLSAAGVDYTKVHNLGRAAYLGVLGLGLGLGPEAG